MGNYVIIWVTLLYGYLEVGYLEGWVYDFLSFDWEWLKRLA
jgi:hypothetical protein